MWIWQEGRSSCFFFVLLFGKTKRFCLCRDPFCNVVRHFKKIIYFTGTPETVEVAQRIASLPSVRLPAEVNYWTTKHSNHPLIQPVRVCVCVCVCVCVSCHSTRACFFLWPLSSFHCNLVSIMKTAACVSFTELLPPGYDERHRGRSEKNTQLQSTWQPKQHGSLHKKKNKKKQNVSIWPLEEKWTILLDTYSRYLCSSSYVAALDNELLITLWPTWRYVSDRKKTH